MSNPAAPVVYTVAHINVTIQTIAEQGAMNPLLFKSCTPPTWSVQAPKEMFHGSQGAIQPIITAVQNPTWTPMTLTQGWDTTFIFAQWAYLMADPKSTIAQKQKKVQVDFCDNTGTTLYSWQTATGLLVSLSTGGSDPSSHSPLINTATIDANSWDMLNAQGQPISAAAQS